MSKTKDFYVQNPFIKKENCPKKINLGAYTKNIYKFLSLNLNIFSGVFQVFNITNELYI